MGTTEPAIDPAKLRKGARDELASLAVNREVIDDLIAIVDERWSQVYRSQSRVCEIVGRLGCADLADGPFDSAAVLAKLDELDAAAEAEAAARDAMEGGAS